LWVTLWVIILCIYIGYILCVAVGSQFSVRFKTDSHQAMMMMKIVGRTEASFKSKREERSS
jgi:hypothetical protein